MEKTNTETKQRPDKEFHDRMDKLMEEILSVAPHGEKSENGETEKDNSKTNAQSEI